MVGGGPQQWESDFRSVEVHLSKVSDHQGHPGQEKQGGLQRAGKDEEVIENPDCKGNGGDPQDRDGDEGAEQEIDCSLSNEYPQEEQRANWRGNLRGRLL